MLTAVRLVRGCLMLTSVCRRAESSGRSQKYRYSYLCETPHFGKIAVCGFPLAHRSFLVLPCVWNSVRLRLMLGLAKFKVGDPQNLSLGLGYSAIWLCLRVACCNRPKPKHAQLTFSLWLCQRLERCHATVLGLTANLSEREANNALQAFVSCLLVQSMVMTILWMWYLFCPCHFLTWKRQWEECHSKELSCASNLSGYHCVNMSWMLLCTVAEI